MRILPVVLFLAHGALLAEGRTGQLSISLSRGEGLGPSGSIVHDLEKRQNDAFTGGKYGYTTFLRGNSDQLLRNAAANAAAPDLSYQSMQTRFAFEYGSSDLVGIGFSIVDQKLNVRGIRSNVSSEPATLLLLSTLYPSSSSAAYNQALIDMELLDPLVRTNALPFVHATSLNALLRIHPMDGILDPYGAFRWDLRANGSPPRTPGVLSQLLAFGFMPGGFSQRLNLRTQCFFQDARAPGLYRPRNNGMKAFCSWEWAQSWIETEIS
jgi:hypothetical protein